MNQPTIMPQPDLKRNVWAAVHEIERTLAPRYPQHFTNIGAAKHHIKKLCHEEKYDYALPRNYNIRPSDPHPIVRTVKDRACFLVAVRAHDQGEFYLDEALPDREALRNAVESNIARLLPLFRTWPSSFCNANVAAKYIAGFCALQKFPYTSFAGVAEEKFRAYVTWNTARRAWEQDRFELGVVPGGWVRKAKPTTMSGAIEADIARLMPLVRCWPPLFVDLNEARNFVHDWCYDNRFMYTGWEGVEPRKYRLFVHFNAAKYALQRGLFRVEHAVPRRQVGTNAVSRVRDGYRPREGEVKVVEVRLAVAQVEEQAGGEQAGGSDTNTRPEDIELANSDISDITGGSDQDSSASSSEVSESEGDTLSQSAVEKETQEAAVPDPFKDLVSELQRGYVLKAAFD